MRFAGFACAVSVGLFFGGVANAEPSASLVEALRSETPSVRQVLRQNATQCQNALSVVSMRDLDECASRLQVSKQIVAGSETRSAIELLHKAEFSVALGAYSSQQAGIAKVGEAMKVFIDFLSAIDLADKPAPSAKKPGKRA